MSNMFKAPPAPPPPPAPQDPPPMPDPESPALQEERRRKAAQALARGGRTSTILSAPESRGGSAGAYGGTKLGSG